MGEQERDGYDERRAYWQSLWDERRKDLEGPIGVLGGIWLGASGAAGWYGGDGAAGRTTLLVGGICFAINLLLKHSAKREVERKVQARFHRQ